MRTHPTAFRNLWLPTALAVCLLAPSAVGQDEADREPGEPMTFHQNENLFSVDLPRNWKTERVDSSKGDLGFWTGPASKKFNAAFHAQVMRSAKRLTMAFHEYVASKSGFEKDSLKTGEGWMQGTVVDGRRVSWRRLVEMDGVITLAEVISHPKAGEELGDFAQSILDKYEQKKAFDLSVSSDDWTVKKAKGMVVWTNVGKKEVGDVMGRTDDLMTDARDILRKGLPGKPYLEATPVVRVYKLPLGLRRAAESLEMGDPNDGYIDPRDWAFCTSTSSLSMNTSELPVRFSSASQYVKFYFGGDVPHWLSAGLSRYGAYGATDGGKPQKWDKDRMKKMKGRIQSANASLDSHFTKTAADYPEGEDVDILWCWHLFMRHAKNSSKFRNTYNKYIQTLRDTGDPMQADALWNDVDFGDMLEAFRKWGKSL